MFFMMPLLLEEGGGKRGEGCRPPQRMPARIAARAERPFISLRRGEATGQAVGAGTAGATQGLPHHHHHRGVVLHQKNPSIACGAGRKSVYMISAPIRRAQCVTPPTVCFYKNLSGVESTFCCRR